MSRILNLSKTSSPKLWGAIRRYAGAKKMNELVGLALAEGAPLNKIALNPDGTRMKKDDKMLYNAMLYFGNKHNEELLVAREIRKAAHALKLKSDRKAAKDIPKIYTINAVIRVMIISKREQFDIIKSFSAQTKQKAFEDYQFFLDKLNQESDLLVIREEYTLTVTKVPPSDFNNELIRASSCIDLDGFVKNDTWCRNMDTCVPDWLTAKYSTVKGHIKSVKSYEIIEHYSTHEITQLGETRVLPSTENGYTLEHIKLYCKNTDKTLYALHNKKLVYTAQANNRCDNPLVIELKNGHLYPYTNTSQIQSIVQYKSGGSRTKISEIKAPLKIEFIKQCGNALEFLVDTMKKHNVMVSGKILMNNKKLGNFKLGDTLFSTNPYCEHTESLCQRKSIPYTGQSAMSFFPELLKEFPKSFFNNEIRSALYASSVKDRVHFGLHNKKSSDLIGLDLNKAYRFVMEHPQDDLIFLDFKSKITYPDYDENLFGLWFIKTADRTLLNGDNWYSNIIVKRAHSDGIKFVAAAFIEANKRMIHVDDEQVVELNPLPGIIEKLSEYYGNDQLTKDAINSLSGYFGKTTSKRANLNVDTDVRRAFESLGHGLVFYQKDGIHVFGKESRVELLEGNLPLYIQILDWSNIRLHDLILKHGGYENLVFRKTDEIVMRKLDIPYNFTTNVGGYKQTDVANRIFKEPRRHNAKFEFEHVPWWDVDIKSSNDHEKVINLIKSGKSLLCSSRAGTGKSYVINKLAESVKCVKLAYTNKAANNINGQTLHSWLGIDDSGLVNKKMVAIACRDIECIIVDEYSMIPEFLWKQLYEIKLTHKVQFFIAGDYRQLPPIDGEVDINCETIRFICDYRRCELEFHDKCRYDIPLYNYLETMKPLPFVSELPGMHICYTNEFRKKINARFNKGLLVPYIGKPNKYNENIRLSIGVPLLALNTSAKNKIVKNEIYTVTAVDSKTFSIDDQIFNHEDVHASFCLAYCITIHKAQGITIDGYVNIHERSRFKDRRMLYTAASRARKLEFVRFIA